MADNGVSDTLNTVIDISSIDLDGYINDAPQSTDDNNDISNIPDYDESLWVKIEGIGHEYTAPQGHPGWKLVKLGHVSGSMVGKAVGRSRFGTPLGVSKQLSGKIIPKFSDKELERMNYGTLMEDEARKFYEVSKNVTVVERGFIVPHWNKHVGVSVDGEVIDENGNSVGIVEIKCPMKMYGPLLNRMQIVEMGAQPANNIEHIWKSHYDQMHLGMRILKKDWCDYIVYCKPENRVFIERVHFDRDHWENVLYPGICAFINNILIPDLAGTPYPLNPKEDIDEKDSNVTDANNIEEESTPSDEDKTEEVTTSNISPLGLNTSNTNTTNTSDINTTDINSIIDTSSVEDGV
jgi:hypothetical protein